MPVICDNKRMTVIGRQAIFRISSNWPEMATAIQALAIHDSDMTLDDPYIQALLIDPDLADQVWELWNAGVITDEVAEWAWAILSLQGP